MKPKAIKNMKIHLSLRSSILVTCAGGTLLLLSAQQASAVDRTWDGSDSNSWGTGTNWSDDTMPAGTGDKAIFTSASGNGYNIVLGGGARTIGNITFDSTTAATPYTINLYDTNLTTTRELTLGNDGITVEAGHHTIAGATPGATFVGTLNLSSSTFNIAADSSLTLSVRIKKDDTSDQYNKTGAGRLVLNANNGSTNGWFYVSGLFTVSQGTLELAASGATGNSQNRYTVSNGATMEISASGAFGSINGAAGALTLNGTGVGGIGALYASATTAISSGTSSIALVGNTRIGVAANQTLTLHQDITESGGARALEKSGTGILSLAAANAYTGGTTVSEGTLLINAANTLTTGALTVADGARLGGNGSTPATATIQSGGKLLVDISDWTGGAGTGFTDLSVGSLTMDGNWTLDVTSLTSYTNFTEANATFPFLTVTTPGGISNFNADNVTITADSFVGTGAWSVVQNGDSLELLYTVGGGDDYQTWDDGYAADLSDKNADNDGDGLSNFEEYAFGLNPTSGASVNPITDLSTLKSAGTFSYTRRAGTGLTYSVWTSTDLEDWGTEPVAADQEAGAAVDGVETVLVTLPAIPTETKYFLRVMAE